MEKIPKEHQQALKEYEEAKQKGCKFYTEAEIKQILSESLATNNKPQAV
mgnify:CR=1 FL=1